jgi:hypothetical protein
MKKTKWYDGCEIDPAYIGLYQCKNRHAKIKYFKYWNGSSWFSVRFINDEKFILLDLPDLFRWQYPFWRGLSRNSENKS